MSETPPPPAPHGLILREKEPLNLETPFHSQEDLLTPDGLFYVRCHFPVPRIATEEWSLQVEGELERPYSLSWDEFRALESRTVTVTMECAGNGRTFLEPQRSGAQWETGAVGTARWTGVPLSELLRRAGVKSTACEIVLEGADSGVIKEAPRPGGRTHFSRSLPLAKAMDDVLLAHQMNGRPLSPEHGFPLRAVVPGWYGMAAVKWLTRIVAVAEPFGGYYQTVDYSWWERSPGGPTLRPITAMRVKSQIARPGYLEVVPAGSTCRVHGTAWSGGGDIVRVEVSTDAGASWSDARLIGEPLPNCWRQWEFHWQVPQTPGRTTLMSRATDSAGHVQPPEHHEDRGSYMIHHWLPVEVMIQQP